MGSHKSKEDDVSKISTSIFITNFPVTFSAKDLFNACKQYGHKIWEQSGVGNSYVQVVKGNNTSVVAESDQTPTLVLDDECLNTSYTLSNSLMGRGERGFASLSTRRWYCIKKVLVLVLSVDSSISKDILLLEGKLFGWRLKWVVMDSRPRKLQYGFLTSWRNLMDEHDFNDDVNEGDLMQSSPIMLRESHFRLWPILLIFHSWLKWKDLINWLKMHGMKLLWTKSNAMSNMMKKLKYLKQKIRDWNKGNMKSSKNIKAKLKDDLKAVDDIIDNGGGNDEVVKLRMECLEIIQEYRQIQSFDAAQKRRIKCP
ncbi:hypothetical protein Tco_0533665 [Tanacetum coccineum]